MFLDTAALLQLWVYVILLIHNHLTLVFSVFFFSKQTKLNTASASGLSLQKIYQILSFFSFLLMKVVRIHSRECLVASFLRFIHLSMYLPVLPTPCFIFGKSSS